MYLLFLSLNNIKKNICCEILIDNGKKGHYQLIPPSLIMLLWKFFYFSLYLLVLLLYRLMYSCREKFVDKEYFWSRLFLVFWCNQIYAYIRVCTFRLGVIYLKKNTVGFLRPLKHLYCHLNEICRRCFFCWIVFVFSIWCCSPSNRVT